MQATEFLALMQQIAPLELAEKWDNVGLLLEPSTAQDVTHVLLTIDLTSDIVDEAAAIRAQAIVAYHPPIFSGLKRLVHADRTGSLILKATQRNLLIYSPHTALDATVGGVNDWLCDAFKARDVRAITPAESTGHPPVDVRLGQGRHVELASPALLAELLPQVKSHLGLTHLRVAQAAAHDKTPIRSVALCAGAGGSVLEHANADLLLTGEMRHHDVLARAQTGTSVILTDHTNTERGYLPNLAVRLRSTGLSCTVSAIDADPLRVV